MILILPKQTWPDPNAATVADVPESETHFHAHEFLDVTFQPRPVYISPNEVYAMHSLLIQQMQHLVCLPAFLTRPSLTSRALDGAS